MTPSRSRKAAGLRRNAEQLAPTLLQCFWQADIEKITVANTSSELPFLREDWKDICLDRAWQGMNAVNNRRAQYVNSGINERWPKVILDFFTEADNAVVR